MTKKKSLLLKERKQQKKPRGWRFWFLIGLVFFFLFTAISGGVLFKLKYEDWKMVWLARKHEQGERYLHQYYEAKLRVKNNPNDEEAYFEIGLAKQELGDSKGAERAYLKSISLDDKNITTINTLAALYVKIKKYPKAEEYYLKALEINPRLISTYQNLVTFYYNDYQEKNSEIEKILLRGLNEMPEDPNLLSLLVSYYRTVAHDNKKAVEIYQRILSLRPDDKLLKSEIERLESK